MLCFYCCLVTIQPWEIQPACFTSLPTPRYAFSQILLPLPFSKQTSSHCSPLAAQKTLQKRPGYCADILQPAQQSIFLFFIGECTEGWNVLETGLPGRLEPHQSQGSPLGAGSPGTRDPRALLMTLLTGNKRSSGQQGSTAIPRVLWCCSWQQFLLGRGETDRTDSHQAVDRQSGSPGLGSQLTNELPAPLKNVLVFYCLLSMTTQASRDCTPFCLAQQGRTAASSLVTII